MIASRPPPLAEAVIEQYLHQVDAALGGLPASQRETVLRELRAHIDELLTIHAAGTGGAAAREPTTQDAHAVLSQLDPPEKYAGRTFAPDSYPVIKTRWLLLGIICGMLQIAGLVCVIIGVPIVGALAGLAAVVNFGLNWANPRVPAWMFKLTGLAALCGVGLIAIEVARAK